MAKKRAIKAAGVKHFCLPKWEARIRAAEKRGRFTKTDVMDAELWDACACHEARTLFPAVVKYAKGTSSSRTPPLDPILNDLGTNFSLAVTPSIRGTAFRRARKILAQITERLAELDVKIDPSA